MKIRSSRGRRFPCWLAVWLAQVAAALALGALTALSLWLGGLTHRCMLWGAMPLAGLAMACAAVCLGLNNYLAWLAPPLMEVLANLLIWGYPPSVGPVFFCAFLSLVGAAAGEVARRRGDK